MAKKSKSVKKNKMAATNSKTLANDINQIFSQNTLSKVDKDLIKKTIGLLDQGQIRVAEKNANQNWQTNEWVKKAILLYFRSQEMKVIKSGDLEFFDKIPTKKWSKDSKVRVVPHAIARYGSHIEDGAILMPSYINIGARVGTGTMIDTWATVGSCAQVGSHCHISGGVGLGGVLEPLQASPVIIEDHAFLGSRVVVVEGVIVREGAVLGAGVTLTSSTKIIDVSGPLAKELKGEVPKNSVVIPGSQLKKFPAGEFGVNCALIIGQRKESTDKKTSLNSTLREFNVSV
jgi:2,3,4,5-tetrahydropyridine-2-carboxylate N-succinyltransferase